MMLVPLEKVSKRSAAERAIDVCTDLREDVNWLGTCSYALWQWADAEYFVSARNFMPDSEPQTSEETDRLNWKKLIPTLASSLLYFHRA